MSQDTPYEFVDMMTYVHTGRLKDCYGAGEQIELLKHAFDVRWILLNMDYEYSGDWYAIFEMNDKYHLLNGYFGTASCCDDLAYGDPYEWLESNVKNVRAFGSIESAVAWLKTTEEYSYTSNVKDHMLSALRVELSLA